MFDDKHARDAVSCDPTRMVIKLTFSGRQERKKSKARVLKRRMVLGRRVTV